MADPAAESLEIQMIRTAEDFWIQRAFTEYKGVNCRPGIRAAVRLIFWSSLNV